MGLARVILVLSALVVSQASSSLGLDGLKVNEKAPNIIARTLDDDLFRLYKAGQGPKVVNFFEVTCVPCKKELPELAGLEARHKNVRFVLVHVGDQSADEVRKFLGSLKARPSTAVYTGKKITETYKFNAFPHTFLLDSDNKIRLILSGYTENNMQLLEAAIKEIE